MGKKKNIKNRIFAGLLALTLASSTPVFAKGEEQIVKEETQTELSEMFAIDYQITGVQYDGFYETKYVSEDGKSEKWYCSYLPEIDGKKRTTESRKIDSIIASSNETCDIEFEHAHLGLGETSAYLFPFYNEDYSNKGNREQFIKTKIIVAVDKEVLNIMTEYDLYRLIDNVEYLHLDINVLEKNNYDALLYFSPVSLNNDNIKLEVKMIHKDDNSYQDHMATYLFDPWSMIIPDENQFMSEIKNQDTVERDKTYSYHY